MTKAGTINRTAGEMGECVGRRSLSTKRKEKEKERKKCYTGLLHVVSGPHGGRIEDNTYSTHTQPHPPT